MDNDIKLDLDSPMYGRAEMLQKYLFNGTTSQIANWMDRDEFPCAPRDDGPSKHYRFTPREAIEATIVGQLLNTVCTDTKTGVKVAARAVDEIARSPIIKVLTKPQQTPTEDFFLQISRGEKWRVRVFRGRDKLEFDHGYTSLGIIARAERGLCRYFADAVRHDG
ncbi:MAG: hypothetical protein ACYTBS_26890 [Planctomycetota bacterium]|jgi:hypothetical protein